MSDSRVANVRRPAGRPRSSAHARDRKQTQRARLLDSMTTLTAEHEYANTSIAQVIARAGVSRPTFYDYFSDKDACFEAALLQARSSMLAAVRAAVTSGAPELAETACVSACLSFANSHPVESRLLLCQSLAGGPRALDQRDALVSELSSVVAEARTDLTPDAAAPDLPPHIAVSTTFWLLARALRLRESLRLLQPELEAWLFSYAAPVGDHSFSSLNLDDDPPPTPTFVSSLPTEAPAVLPPGRSRLSRGEVLRNQRERILHAVGDVSFEKGFNATSITDIASSAGVELGIFYANFPDKLAAFLSAHFLGFEHNFAVSAGAFFSASSWPERVRRAIIAGTHFQSTHASLTHKLYVQSYALPSDSISQIEDARSAFGLFLQEGNERLSNPHTPAFLRAIAAANFEISFHLSRAGRGPDIPRAAPLMTYLSLAPFLGHDGAVQTALESGA
jgi:AcrR family transcriptional regulator